MKTLSIYAVSALAAMLAMSAPAQISTNYSFAVNQNVPDVDANGIALTANVNGLPGVISSLTISLDITGGYNGDLYSYLVGPNGGFAVLLNRVGVSSNSAFGYSQTGFNITLDDAAANSVHFYQGHAPTIIGGRLTGTWQPDGENIDPQSAAAGFPATQTAMLASFLNQSPNGTWTLFFADLSGGGTSQITGWGLNVVTVPEPSAFALAALGGMSVFFFKRRGK